MVDAGGEVRYTIYTRVGVREASFQGCFYMSWKDWGAVKWHIYMDLHDVNYPLWQFCVCAVVTWNSLANWHDIHGHWRLVGSVVALVQSNWLDWNFLSSWYKLLLSGSLAWCLRTLLWARTECGWVTVKFLFIVPRPPLILICPGKLLFQ